jgi:hypothetical protein
MAVVALLAAACGERAERPDTVDTVSVGGSPAPAGDTTSVDTARFEGTTARTTRDAGDAAVATLREVRTAARAGGFERIVFEFDARVPGYTIEYQERPAECGSGAPASIAGAASLVVQLRPAQAHEAQGEQQVSSISRRDVQPGYDAVRQLKVTCDFEATVTWTIGIDARRPYRVLTLEDPPRLVVDVQSGVAKPSGSASPEATVSPTSAAPGTTLNVRASGLPANSLVEIGVGPPESEFRVTDTARTDASGSVSTTIRVPEWVSSGREYVVAVVTPDYRQKAISNRFRIGG